LYKLRQRIKLYLKFVFHFSDMKKIIGLIIILSIIACTNAARSQNKVSIPAFTAYAMPAEESNEAEESTLFSEKNGLEHWSNLNQQIQFYFDIGKPGSLDLALLMKSDNAGNKLTASFAGKKFSIAVPGSSTFKKISIGRVTIKEPGFYMLSLSSLFKKGKTIADIKSLELSGEATTGIHFNAKPRRNAASVHLMYPLDDSMKVVSFYNELTVPGGADPLHTYFMACGFARGYFGMQVNSPTERRIIFSVWDAGNEAVDRNKVNDDNKVQLMAKGENVFADGFGNEGTGGHSHLIYNWKTGVPYKFLVTAATDSATNTTSYAGYFFIPEEQRWKLIACFKAPKDGKPLRKLYSFVENFWGNNGQLLRKAWFGNQWIRRETGEWKAITESRFSYDATGKAGDRIDYGGGTEDNQFYLWNGGFKNSTTKFGDIYKRDTNNLKPAIDFYKNADSAAEAVKETAVILNAIQAKTIDSTGTSNGIYYKILREGTGEKVSVSDTLVVNYKGQLLNGFIFDQTKDKPATFPLKRLIKGWQAGLPFCREGGKIRLVIPSSLGYSIRNLGVIPPNSILIFDVEVLEIKRAK
jgi:FKBP-type peptidyl-prolyl cis-trans isomerase